MQPRLCEAPLLVDLARRNADHFSRLGDAQAGEVPQFHDLGLPLVVQPQLRERLVQRQDLGRVAIKAGGHLHKLPGPSAAAALVPSSFTCVVHEELAHGICGGGEEMSAVAEKGVRNLLCVSTRRAAPRQKVPDTFFRLAHEAQIGFVYEHGGLKVLTMCFLSHPGLRYAVQVVVKGAPQPFRGRRIAVSDGRQQRRDLTLRALHGPGPVAANFKLNWKPQPVSLQHIRLAGALQRPLTAARHEDDSKSVRRVKWFDACPGDVRVKRGTGAAVASGQSRESQKEGQQP